jgi:hypothetical protein
MTEQTIYKDGGPLLICGDGRTHVRNKVNRVFTKLRTGLQVQTNCFSLLKNEQNKFIFVVPGKRYRDDTILEISSSRMAKVVEAYLEQRRLKLHEWTQSQPNRTQGQKTSTNKMSMIMDLVKNSSKSRQIHREMVLVSGSPVFCQLIHDTDADSLTLLLVKDFESMEVFE